MPYKFKSNTFSTTGYFCSWECMKAYAYDKNRLDIVELISFMKKRTDGKYSIITRAPKKECLKVFGGELTIEEFRKNKPETSIHLPFEHFQLPLITNRNLIEFNYKKEEDGTTELKLKRAKPLSRTKGKLETLLKQCSDVADTEKKS
jgi:hypothetical protein